MNPVCRRKKCQQFFFKYDQNKLVVRWGDLESIVVLFDDIHLQTTQMSQEYAQSPSGRGHVSEISQTYMGPASSRRILQV